MKPEMTAMDLALTVQRAASEVESAHHFHGRTCICGYASDRARSRTEHLTQQIVAATNVALVGETP